jgi:hypothetical protein
VPAAASDYGDALRVTAVFAAIILALLNLTLATDVCTLILLLLSHDAPPSHNSPKQSRSVPLRPCGPRTTGGTMLAPRTRHGRNEHAHPRCLPVLSKREVRRRSRSNNHGRDRIGGDRAARRSTTSRTAPSAAKRTAASAATTAAGQSRSSPPSNGSPSSTSRRSIRSERGTVGRRVRLTRRRDHG